MPAFIFINILYLLFLTTVIESDFVFILDVLDLHK